MGVLAIVIYCTLFCLAYTWTLVWILERREKKYRQGTFAFTDAFIVGALAGIFVYISNIVAIMRWGGSAFLYDVVLITALAAFGTYKETRYKARAGKVTRRQRAEVRLLEYHINKDPANAAYYERLSEVQEKLGNKENALAAAKRAAEIHPDVKIAWRIKQLEGK